MLKNIYPGKFIVFEGLDGSGQTTQANLLKNFLLKRGYKAILTKEPTINSAAGKEIRKVLDKEKKISAAKLQQFFALDRKKHLEKEIIPNLKRGAIVISDRYFFSSFAYGGADGLSLRRLIKLNEEFLLPDLTFIFKISPATCIKRIKKRGNKRTLFEKKQKLKMVLGFYENLAKTFKNIKIINGEKTIKQVFSPIKEIILRELNSKLKV